MRAGSVILLSFLVSVAVTLGFYAFVAPHLPVMAVDVPSLRGLTTAQARGLLDARGLRLVVEDERVCGDVAEGMACDQRPLPDSRLPRGGEVRVSLSAKASTVRVPRVSGMTADAAKAVLTGAHLRVGSTTNASSTTVPGGLAIGTDPAEGSTAPLDSAVVLTLATEMKPVPSLFGKHVSSAKQALEAAGFQLGAVKHGNDDDRDPGEIIGQTPKANEPAPVGSKIDVVVNE
jgi:serine/threonine-protein kinase